MNTIGALFLQPVARHCSTRYEQESADAQPNAQDMGRICEGPALCVTELSIEICQIYFPSELDDVSALSGTAPFQFLIVIVYDVGVESPHHELAWD